MSEHNHLKALSNWCKSTKDLRVNIGFHTNAERDKDFTWTVRVVANSEPNHRPIRTMQGEFLELLCEEMLPEAQRVYELQKVTIKKRNAEKKRQYEKGYAADMRELYAMHHTADDY